MGIQDIVHVVDRATAEDIQESRSDTVMRIYDDYVTEFFSNDALTPQSFVDFWQGMTPLEKIRFLTDYGYA